LFVSQIQKQKRKERKAAEAKYEGNAMTASFYILAYHYSLIVLSVNAK
jgi:hypothetical protein